MKNNIPMQELNLNIENQIKDIKKPLSVGYEFDKGEVVFVLMIPNIFK